MKKALIILLIIASLAVGWFFGSQINKSEANVTEKHEGLTMNNVDSSNNQEDLSAIKKAEEDLFTLSSKDMFSSTLTLNMNNGTSESFEFPYINSLPFDYSPSGKKLLLNPQDYFDVGSSLYTYSEDEGLTTIIDEYKEDYTPRGALWVDERYILVRQVYRHGSGSFPSGNIEVYDTQTDIFYPLDVFTGAAVLAMNWLSVESEPILVFTGATYPNGVNDKVKILSESYSLAEIYERIESAKN